MNYILKLKLQFMYLMYLSIPYMAVRIGSHTISTKQFKMDLCIIFKDYRMEKINLIFFYKIIQQIEATPFDCHLKSMGKA